MDPLRVVALCALAMGVVGGSIGALTRPDHPAGPVYILAKNILYWATWALVIPVVGAVVSLVRTRRWSMRRTLAAHAAIAVSLAGAHRLVLVVFDSAVAAWRFGATPSVSAIVGALGRTDRMAVEWELTMYAAVAAFATASGLLVESGDRALRQARIERELALSKLALLETRLQPHFLLNALHAVTALIRRDPDGAEEVVARLGRILRAHVETDSGSQVSMAEDLAALEDYLAIERRQMRDRLQVTLAIEPEALGALVPRLLVQPLVENAIRHGLQPRARGGSVRVAAQRVGDRLSVEVEDDGVGFGQSRRRGAGLGLGSARDRLQALFGEQHRFVVESVPGKGTRVAIGIPFQEAPR